jgi:hypothetical protein
MSCHNDEPAAPARLVHEAARMLRTLVLPPRRRTSKAAQIFIGPHPAAASRNTLKYKTLTHENTP